MRKFLLIGLPAIILLALFTLMIVLVRLEFTLTNQSFMELWPLIYIPLLIGLFSILYFRIRAGQNIYRMKKFVLVIIPLFLVLSFITLFIVLSRLHFTLAGTTFLDLWPLIYIPALMVMLSILYFRIRGV